MLILLTQDLMLSSSVAGAAAAAGAELKVAESARRAHELANDTQVSAVFVDLGSLDVGIDSLASQFKQFASPPAVIAFGPHVHEAKLAAARDAGCDEVLSRGQFHRQMEPLLRQYGN